MIPHILEETAGKVSYIDDISITKRITGRNRLFRRGSSAARHMIQAVSTSDIDGLMDLRDPG